METSSFNRVTVNLTALEHNYKLLKGRVADVAFLAMVKADAYGHGMVESAIALEKAGCRIFGVAELREAIVLRDSGLTGSIFSMLGFAEEDASAFVEYDLIPVVYDRQSLEALSIAADKAKKNIEVHLKVDTGMSRLGVGLSEFADLLNYLEKLPGIKIGGIASHFPCADDIESSVTSDNFGLFNKFIEKTRRYPSIVHHIANSGATLYHPQTHCNMVRCGISLYGYYPDGRSVDNPLGLRQVMSFSTRIVQVKDVPKGAGVSYGHTYITKRPTKLAVLPVGYEDGYSRKLSNCGEVLVRGRRAFIRGRVCMNLCMVDVTDIEGVAPGDEVVLLGVQEDESITADELASRCDTISYEILCMIGNNNHRKFI